MEDKGSLPSSPSTEPQAPAKRQWLTIGRVWDVLALAAIAFVIWKIFVMPRNLAVANAHPAPRAIYQKLDGGTFRLADQRGRVVFLDFYASWCEPCKISLPLVESWAKAHPNSVVVPVDVAEPRVAVIDFARRHGLSNVALDPNANSQALFDVKGFPTMVVVDTSGRVRASWEGLNPAIDSAMSNAEQTLSR